jgi:hypothetical protein
MMITGLWNYKERSRLARARSGVARFPKIVTGSATDRTRGSRERKLVTSTCEQNRPDKVRSRLDGCRLAFGEQHTEVTGGKLYRAQRFAAFASFHKPRNFGGGLVRQHDPESVFAASLTAGEPSQEERKRMCVLGNHQVKAMGADDSEIGIQHAPAITLHIGPSKLWRNSALPTWLLCANRAIVDALL